MQPAVDAPVRQTKLPPGAIPGAVTIVPPSQLPPGVIRTGPPIVEPIAQVVPDPNQPAAPQGGPIQVSVGAPQSIAPGVTILDPAPTPPATPAAPATPQGGDSIAQVVPEPAAPANPLPAATPAATPAPAPAPTPAATDTPPAPPVTPPAPEPAATPAVDINAAILGQAPAPTPAVPASDPIHSALASHLQAAYQISVDGPDAAIKIYDNAIDEYVKAKKQVQQLELKNQELATVAADPRLEYLKNDGVQEILGLLEDARSRGVKNVLEHVAEHLAPLAQNIDSYTEDQLAAKALRDMGTPEARIPDFLASMSELEKLRYANETRKQLRSEREKRVAQLNEIKKIKPQAAATPDPAQVQAAQQEVERFRANYRLNVIPQVEQRLKNLNGYTLNDSAVKALSSNVSTYMDMGEDGRTDFERHVLHDENGALRPEVLAAIAPFDRRLNPQARQLLTQPKWDLNAIRAQVRQEVIAELAQSQLSGSLPASGKPIAQQGDIINVSGVSPAAPGALGALKLKVN